MFVGCCVCVCFAFLFIFLVGVATLFATTIDNDGSLWCLLELHGCKKQETLILCCYLQSKKEAGVCVKFDFLGLKNETDFRYGVKGFGLVFKRILDVCN